MIDSRDLRELAADVRCLGQRAAAILDRLADDADSQLRQSAKRRRLRRFTDEVGADSASSSSLS